MSAGHPDLGQVGGTVLEAVTPEDFLGSREMTLRRANLARRQLPVRGDRARGGGLARDVPLGPPVPANRGAVSAPEVVVVVQPCASRPVMPRVVSVVDVMPKRLLLVCALRPYQRTEDVRLNEASDVTRASRASVSGLEFQDELAIAFAEQCDRGRVAQTVRHGPIED